MLRITEIQWHINPSGMSPNEYFKTTHCIKIFFEAPILWVLDASTQIYRFNVNLPVLMEENGYVLNNKKLSDMVSGSIQLQYSDLIAISEDYLRGFFDYGVCDREWKDLCETILDMYGVRTILEERGVLNAK